MGAVVAAGLCWITDGVTVGWPKAVWAWAKRSSKALAWDLGAGAGWWNEGIEVVINEGEGWMGWAVGVEAQLLAQDWEGWAGWPNAGKAGWAVGWGVKEPERNVNKEHQYINLVTVGYIWQSSLTESFITKKN